MMNNKIKNRAKKLINNMKNCKSMRRPNKKAIILDNICLILKSVGVIIAVLSFIFIIAYLIQLSVKFYRTYAETAMFFVAVAAFIFSAFEFFIKNLLDTLVHEYTIYEYVISINYANNLSKELYRISKKEKIYIKSIDIVEFKNKLYLKIVYL